MLLSLVSHEVDGELIPQRMTDGYVNATALCKASGKQFNDYFRLKITQDFLNELSMETGIPVTGIPVTGLVAIKQGGTPQEQGTWVHPQVAVNLAQWLSAKFAVLVSRWIMDWMSGKIPGGNLPYHVRRMIANDDVIPPTHFSVLNEIIYALVAPMERRGYILPENLLPDISQGRMFCKWLREEKGLDTDALPTYPHKYEDGRVVQAKMYPIELLADFRKHFYGTWIPSRMLDYFSERDEKALPLAEELAVKYQDYTLEE